MRVKITIITILFISLQLKVFSQEYLIGLYFAETYIDLLNETKNHYASMNNSICNDCPQAIQITLNNYDYELLELWNFHEGTTVKLLSPEEEVLINTDHRFYSYRNGILFNGIANEQYLKVSTETSLEKFNDYITDALFASKEYISDIGAIEIINKKLYIDKNEYDLVIDTGGFPNSIEQNLYLNKTKRSKLSIDVLHKQIILSKFDEILLVPNNDNVYYFYELDHIFNEPGYFNIARLGYDENNINLIKAMSKQELRLLRNTIFALHGYQFTNKELYDFFSKFEWYTPDATISNTTLYLTDSQKELLDFIFSLE